MQPQIRSIQGAVDEIKSADPKTAITAHALRVAVKKGQIPHFTSGRKVLVNMQCVYDFLNNSLYQ